MTGRDFRGIWIPKELWNKNDIRLSIIEKCYLGLIATGISEKECDYIMQLGNVKSLSRIKGELYLKGLYIPDKIKNKTAEDAKEFTIKNSYKGLKCEWCGNTCYMLQEHHFPIPKSKGGTETVKICPNCHATYHSIFREDNLNEIR